MAVLDQHRLLPQQCNKMSHREEDVPSDEEAQDSAQKRVVILGTPSSSRRRRSKSLHSALPERLAPLGRSHSSWNRPPTPSFTGYESEPSDLSASSSEDAPIQLEHSRLGFCGEDPSAAAAAVVLMDPPPLRHSRRWPFRILLFLCAYVAWTTDSFQDGMFVRKRPIPTTAVAFSSQHGREVTMPIQPMGKHSQIHRVVKKETYIPPPATKQKKIRPNLAHARSSKHSPPILGQNTIERFVMDEEEMVGTTNTVRPLHSHRWLGYALLIVLVLEAGIRETQRRRSTPRQRLRNE